MSGTDDRVTLQFSRAVIDDVQHFVASTADRLHSLLERNTDDDLTDGERRELEALVYVGQIGQILELAAMRPAGVAS